MRKLATVSTQAIQISPYGQHVDPSSGNFAQISYYTIDLPTPTDNINANIYYIRTESFSENMEKFGMEPQLSLNFAGGIVKFIKSLNDDRTGNTSFVYTIFTAMENSNAFPETKISIDLNIEVTSPYIREIQHLLEGTACDSDFFAVTCYVGGVKIEVPEANEYAEGNLINKLAVNRFTVKKIATTTNLCKVTNSTLTRNVNLSFAL